MMSLFFGLVILNYLLFINLKKFLGNFPKRFIQNGDKATVWDAILKGGHSNKR